MPDDLHSGFSPAEYGVVAPPPPPLPAQPMQLRPLSIGEILDRTFSFYRSRFLLFVGIGAVPSAVLTLSSAIRLIYVVYHPLAVPTAAAPTALSRIYGSASPVNFYLLPLTFLFLVLYGLSYAAATSAVLDITAGATTSIAAAYERTRGRWLRWIGIVLRQFWAVAWPPMVAMLLIVPLLLIPDVRSSPNMITFILGLFGFVGFIVGFIFYLRYTLAIAAGVQQDLGVRAALARAKFLIAGHKSRIFLLLLLALALQIVLAAAQAPFAYFATQSRGAAHILLQALQLLLQFSTAAIISPFAAIALCLVYLDERVRKEGYDIEVLMQQSAATSTHTATSTYTETSTHTAQE